MKKKDQKKERTYHHERHRQPRNGLHFVDWLGIARTRCWSSPRLEAAEYTYMWDIRKETQYSIHIVYGLLESAQLYGT